VADSYEDETGKNNNVFDGTGSQLEEFEDTFVYDDFNYKEI
jgi:hypothetical protein